MAIRKPEKKKKKVTAKKLAPKRKAIKAKKKIAKLPKKKLVKKIMKAAVKPKVSVKPLHPEPKDGNAATRKLLGDMREKLISEISGSRIPESLAASSEIGDLVDQAVERTLEKPGYGRGSEPGNSGIGHLPATDAGGNRRRSIPPRDSPAVRQQGASGSLSHYVQRSRRGN